MDVGFMMGHGPLRSYVMGYERCQNQVDASDEEISKMSELVTEAIEAGALGFSTSGGAKSQSSSFYGLSNKF